jgi:AraC family transcriptional regulator of adaptative response/methylated-DNA-[protein]-cysteine methyltransferase
MLNVQNCWKAVQQRDAKQNGQFFYGVITTGVYCRPSCRSRKPLRKNVRFYASPADAEKDGLRPCLRCRPLISGAQDPLAVRMQEICRLLESHSDEPLQLGHLAQRAGLSTFHFQRSFKAAVGVTPKQYLQAFRLKNLKHNLKVSKDVTQAVYDAGYGSSSRVYENADTRLGMTPSQYRQGGRNVTISYASQNSALGTMLIGATDRGLCFIQFGESQKHLLASLKKEYPAANVQAMEKSSHPEFVKWMEALARHLEGSQPHLDLPVDIRATSFQMRVWNYLQSIPYGEVQSYTEVAAGIGHPSAVRAVATACARNTLAILIPCHRVIRGNGALGGYRWGLARKRTLIDLERAAKTRAGYQRATKL